MLCACLGCTRLDDRLQQHQEKLDSIAASTVAIGEAWLAGQTSGTYTITALEQMLQLVEKERRELAGTPEALIDARGARLSQTAEQLSRLLAATRHEVRGANADAVRQHIANVSARRS